MADISKLSKFSDASKAINSMGESGADSKKITQNVQETMTKSLAESANASRTDPTTAQNQASGRASEAPRSSAAEASKKANEAAST